MIIVIQKQIQWPVKYQKVKSNVSPNIEAKKHL